MAASIGQIRAALADAIDEIAGMSVYAYLKGNPTLPAVMVSPMEAQYHQAMHDGVERIMFTVSGFAALGLDQTGQENLDKMLAPDGVGSVKAAIEKDISLGGLVQSCYVIGWSNYTLVTLQENVQAMRADWSVAVLL